LSGFARSHLPETDRRRPFAKGPSDCQDFTRTARNTYVCIVDPWDRGVGTPGAPGNYATTHATGSRYVQLDRLAGGPAQERIRVNAMDPDAEAKLANDARTARRAAQGTAETTRSGQLNIA
jgi:hypothetical protein